MLSDEGSKRLYDQTGEVDDGDDAFSDRAPDQSWADYFAERFSSVSAELIEDDRRAYQGSEEEKGDIAAACVARCCAPAGLWGHFWRRYTRHRGDVDRIVEEIPHCSVVDGDDDRIRDIIAGLIAAGALTAETAFTKESKSKRASRKDSVRRLRAGSGPRRPDSRPFAWQAQREAAEADALREKILGPKAGGGMDLVAMIKKRQSDRGSLGAMLAGVGDEDPLSDADFEATRKRLDAERKAKKKKSK